LGKKYLARLNLDQNLEETRIKKKLFQHRQNEQTVVKAISYVQKQKRGLLLQENRQKRRVWFLLLKI
jgi:hypothetical protein